MKISDYYKYQVSARGMNGVADLMDAVIQKKGLYDRIVLPWMPKAKNAKIFELGCGAGIFQKWCLSHGYTNVFGSDFSEQQITLAHEAGINVKLSNSITDLREFDDECLDCVVALDFYEHLLKEDFLDLIALSFKKLKSGGILILRGPNGGSPIWGNAFCNDITHYFALTPTAFRALLGMMGYSTVSFYDDAIPSINHKRIFRVPLALAAQAILRGLIRLATRERVEYLSASIFCIATKK